MTEADALELMQRALLTVMIVAGPMVAAAMAVGVIIALLQALTQVQEMTLTFVPKIIAIVGVMGLGAPFIGATLYSFTEFLYSRIASGF